MELYVFAVIVIVFLASFFSLLFISKLPRGKTFDEVLAEKRQAAEKVYGTSVHKTVRQKTKKVNPSKKSTKQKSKEPKEIDLDTFDDVDSDTQSDGDGNMNNSPTHIKGHVEFSETEIISENESKKSTVTKNNQPQKRKNSKSGGSGILINKNDTQSIKISEVTETLNHFDVIHPKDDLEKLKSHQKEDESKTNSNKHHDKNTNKEQKKGKNKKENQIVSVSDVINDVVLVKEEKTAAVVAVVGKFQENVPFNHGHVKEKMNKKKKNEFELVQKLIDEREGISVNFLIPLLSKAELTRSEIQILIDFLLNKQQDTITVDHSEWSEGRSDIVLKLKKQLSEKERTLKDEQDASVAIQAKLRELRVEINTERAQFNANIKAYVEEINKKKMEIQNLSSEIQYISDKFNAEKQTLTVQLQQLQTKMIQEKKANSQELLQQIQQLTENNQSLVKDLGTKNSIINELTSRVEESYVNYEKKVTDLDQMSRQFKLVSDKNILWEQEIAQYRQINQDLAARESDITTLQNEIHQLRTELSTRNEDYDKYFLSRQFEVEKLKTQLAEQTKQSHIDDTNKVEIRNLQNALDSSRKELNESHTEILDYKSMIDDLNIQVNDFKTKINNVSVDNVEQTNKLSELNNVISNYKTALNEKDSKLSYYEKQARTYANKEDELFKQIEEHKGKNNDLRTKNWKLVEALQTAESNAVKKISNNNNINIIQKKECPAPLQTPPVDLNKILQEEQTRTKEMLKTIFPDVPEGGSLQYDKWIEHLGVYIKETFIKKTQQNNSIGIGEKNDNYNNNNNIKQKETKSTTTDDNDDNNVDIDDDDNLQTSSTKLLKDANLLSKLNSCKKVMTDTDILLSNFEKESKERELYWQNLMDIKNAEIETLKINISTTAQTT